MNVVTKIPLLETAERDSDLEKFEAAHLAEILAGKSPGFDQHLQ